MVSSSLSSVSSKWRNEIAIETRSFEISATCAIFNMHGS